MSVHDFYFFDFSFREGEQPFPTCCIFYDYGLVSVELMAAGGHVLPFSVLSVCTL